MAEVRGGRGKPASLAPAVQEGKAYLSGIEHRVTDYVHQQGAAEVTGPHAAEHVQRLTDLTAKAYPDYADPFMIQYGIYGLADQVAAAR